MSDARTSVQIRRGVTIHLPYYPVLCDDEKEYLRVSGKKIPVS